MKILSRAEDYLLGKIWGNAVEKVGADREQTESGLATLAGFVINGAIEYIFERRKLRPTRHEILKEKIEEDTLYLGKSFEPDIFEMFEKSYSRQEIEGAISELIKAQRLAPHQGPFGVSYTHKNKFKQLIANIRDPL